MLRCLIIGSGARVAEELAQVDRSDFALVIGVNAAAHCFGPVDIHVSLHPERYGKAEKAAHLVAPYEMPGVDEVHPWQWPGCSNSGSSGLYAVKVALHHGATEIVLAGIGMDETPHFSLPQPWQDWRRYRDTWERVAPQLRGRVTSLGGWTRELLARQRGQHEH